MTARFARPKLRPMSSAWLSPRERYLATRIARFVSLAAAVVACNRGAPRSDEPRARASASSPPATTSSAAAAPDSAAVAPPASSKACLTPESLALTRLNQLHRAEPGERAAIAAARRELTRELQEPAEYYATLQSSADLVIMELWHESTFAPENCGKTTNPGERNRTLSYDVRKARIVATKVWR